MRGKNIKKKKLKFGQKSKCDKIHKLKLWQNLKYDKTQYSKEKIQIMTKKIPNCNETKKATILKNLNSNKTQNSSCGKTQMKLWQNSKIQSKSKILTKLKSSNFDNTHFQTLKGLLVRTRRGRPRW